MKANKTKQIKKISDYVVIPSLAFAVLILLIASAIHNLLGLEGIYFLNTLTALLVMSVFAFVAFCCVYLYKQINDYRRYLYLIMTLPFLIISIGLILELISKEGGQLIAIGFVLQTSLSGFLATLRAAETWFNNKDIPINLRLGSKKEQRKCQKVQALSVPPNLYRN